MDRKVPLRSVQTVRIVKLYKPLSLIRQGNILSALNEMQFTDCIRTEKCLYDVFSDRVSLSNRTDREAVFSDRVSLSILDNPLKFAFGEGFEFVFFCVSRVSQCR